ncbi:unnamed protein product [Camellia sinensis]
MIKPRKLYLENILSCQQCASVAIAIKMGISICTTALPLWDEVVGSTTAAEVGDGDEVMQAVTTNAAIG